MLQSNFKTKLNSVEHRERIKVWCLWKRLCKAEPDKYKIKIEGDERMVVLMLLQWAWDDREWVQIQSLEWSLE